MLVRGRPLQPVCGPKHGDGELADGLERRLGGPHGVQRRKASLAKGLELLLHASRCCDRAAAKPAFDEVDAVALQARVRRAQIPEQLTALGAAPRKAKEGEERLAVSRLAEPERRVDRVGHT
jgi:hypothetical protein